MISENGIPITDLMNKEEKSLDKNSFKDFALEHGIKYLEHEELSKHTSFKIGGPAEIFAKPSSKKQVSEIVDYCKNNNVPLFPLGKGSNLLVSDAGFRGVVLKLASGGAPERLDGERIRCFGGVALPALSRFAQVQGLTGLEFACGIPGSVGGAVLMNAGAYGGCMGDVLESVTVLRGDRTVELPANELALGYRHTAMMESGEPIVSATFRLQTGDAAAIDARMTELLTARREKQPLEYPSAGSFFKRPEGHFAGALIENCGLKGFRVGNAEISRKHAGFVINVGGATCADVQELARQVRRKVLTETGVLLEPEVRLIGEEWKSWEE